MAYLLIYGELPSSRELARWDEALMRHSAVPDAVERAVAALPHDAHFMGIVLTAINALSTVHPEQNPALAGQNIYQSKEIQDKQIVRLIGAQCLYSWGHAATLLVLCQETVISSLYRERGGMLCLIGADSPRLLYSHGDGRSVEFSSSCLSQQVSVLLAISVYIWAG